MISPWESSFFGFYDHQLVMRSMYERNVYINDTFGLKTLNNTDRLKFHQVNGLTHNDFLFNLDFFKNFILPYLI
jgi:palmitoyl-protein thioesterase